MSWLPWRRRAAERLQLLRAEQEERFLATERAREQRQAELAVLQTALERMAATVEKTLDVSAQNAAIFQRFLDSYNIAEPPRLRDFDEEAEMERYLKRRKAPDTPPELAGLDRPGQFKALLDKMDTFAID